MSGIRPGKYDPIKPDIELLDYKSKKRYGLKLEGSGALQVGTISQDDSVLVRNVGKRVGDFDEQRSWKSGRGKENLSESPEGYWDSKDLWTLTSGHAHPTILWRFARGLRSCDFFMPDDNHSLAWRQLIGSYKYISVPWTSSGLTADYLRMWIRKYGTPGTLTVKLHSNSSGSPGTVLQTITVTADDVTDVVSILQLFNFSGTQAFSASTLYHISMFGASTDNKNNCWGVGGYASGVNGKISTNGSSWTSDPFEMYFYIADADIPRKFFSFMLDGAMYIVDKKDSGAVSDVYINGDRGTTTSATSTTLTDSARAHVVDRWAGAWVKIIRGTGRGQVRQIASNTATQLTVDTAWSITPSTDSEYIIYGTDWFTRIASTSGVVSSTPVVVNRIVYFPQGTTTIQTMIWNPTTTVHSFETDDGMLTYMTKAMSSEGVKIWGVNHFNYLYSAPAVAWATSPTNLTWSAGQDVGDTSYNSTGINEKDGLVYVFKEDGVWSVTSTGIIVKLQSGIEKVPSPSNGLASITHQQFLYHSWLHSLVRIYGSSHDDVGQDWSGWGLPDGREGEFSSLDSYTSLLLASIDAGTGTGCVMGWDGIGWHELLRAYDSNKRVSMVKMQPCVGTRNRMWTDIGGDLVYQEMPYLKGSPRLDSGVRYMHEAVLESAAIDMGTASGLPKFIKEITIYAENLGDGNEIYVDYQIDDDVETNNWTHAGVAHTSPESTVFLGLSNVRKFAYRLRIHSDDNTLPVDILGVTPNGYARAPYKMVWTLRCRADNVTARGRIVKPDELMRWLLDNARFPGRLEMHSQYELAHKFFVIVHPPRMFPYKPAQNGQAEESVFTIVLEEA